ncbi:glycosyltransferase family 2 protein [Zobellia galactanivorans]|uniref:Glycosyltransferase, family GT2 n=1 Tax=Zobellia galactanivorans (strain DSM 12802 / CCUG 47099 / CIP 106680 / NCIMB 13871 / Dsij) TaxID=63186 RepID=G0L1U3_ZOBGA|nr:glycosyltransferase family 2 protein [Zobellia galactanivorans]CAZ97905.1 Glycosyltransferase, family GT2 [Zobellia galactanivorans]
MFSILTPTYNRADVIDRVYYSLKKQTLKDFEWIIIDDAGTDHTSELVRKWQEEPGQFNITYHKLETNMGKAPAVNYGLSLCSRPITIIADDDDTFISTTLEDLKQVWDTVNKTENGHKIAAVWTLVQDEDNKIIGEKYPSDFWQVNFKQRVLERNAPPLGEKWHSWRTKVLKEYKMHYNPNSHIGPGVTWNIINKDYDFLCLNMVHRTYWYTKDGIIQQKKSRLKVEKRNYYSSYYQLEKVNTYLILREPYYRKVAFNYIKARFFYKDKTTRLGNLRFLACAIAFCITLPKRILMHI